MAKTPSTMLPLGTPCPPFALTDARTGATVRHDDAPDAPALLVMFVCNHCPYVVHVQREITRLGREYTARGVRVVAINSNSQKTHPQDGPEAMARLARDLEWTFPFAFDDTQDVARAFAAACTPEFYLFGSVANAKGDAGARSLAYRGQLDDSRPGSGTEPDGRDLRAALDAVLAGRAPDVDQKPSVGCNIKWHPR